MIATVIIPLINKIINSNLYYYHSTWNFLKNLYFLTFLRPFLKGHIFHTLHHLCAFHSQKLKYSLWNSVETIMLNFSLPAVPTAVSNQRPSFYINYKQLFRNICDNAFFLSVIFEKSSKVFLQRVDKKTAVDRKIRQSCGKFHKTVAKNTKKG